MLEQILEQIRTNSITKLTLSDEKFNDADIRALAKVLQKNTSVKEIRLGFAVSDRGFKVFAKMLEINTSIELLIVSLEGNEIDDESAKFLAEALKKNSTIKRLYISNNRISEEGFLAIVEALKINNSLIDFRPPLSKKNPLFIDGIKAIAEILKINKTLENIVLELMTDEGIEILANALKTNTKVTSLYLNGKITDRGAKAIAEMLEHNFSIQSLTLKSGHIGSSGFKALAEALKLNIAATYVSLISSPIDAVSARAFIDTLKVNNCLVYIGFDKNVLTKDERNKISAIEWSNRQKAELLENAIKAGDLETVQQEVVFGTCLNNHVLNLARANKQQVIVDYLLTQIKQPSNELLEEKYEQALEYYKAQDYSQAQSILELIIAKSAEFLTNKDLSIAVINETISLTNYPQEHLKVDKIFLDALIDTSKNLILRNHLFDLIIKREKVDDSFFSILSILKNKDDNLDIRLRIFDLIDQNQDLKLHKNIINIKFEILVNTNDNLELREKISAWITQQEISNNLIKILKVIENRNENTSLRKLLISKLENFNTIEAINKSLHGIVAFAGENTDVRDEAKRILNKKLGKTSGSDNLFNGEDEQIPPHDNKSESPSEDNAVQQQAILLAVQQGDWNAIEQLINANLELLGAENNQGQNPLMLSIIFNQKNIARRILDLLRNNIDLIEIKHAKDKQGNNALHLAAQFNRIELLEDLLELDQQNKNNAGQFPLHISILNQHHIFTGKLIDKAKGNPDVLKIMLNTQAECEIEGGNFKLNALQIAVAQGNVKLAKLLISYAADPAFVDDQVGSLLHIAIRFDQLNIFNFLTNSHQLSITTSNSNFPNCLIYASALGRASFITNIYETKKFNSDALLGAANAAAKNLQINALVTLHHLYKKANPGANLLSTAANGKSPKQIIDSLIEEAVAIGNNKQELIIKEKRTKLDIFLNDQFKQRYENLVISGGGAKGIAFIGALSALNEKDTSFLNNLKHITGTSAGAITAVLLATGFNLGEIKDLLSKTKFTEFLDYATGLKIEDIKNIKEDIEFTFTGNDSWFSILVQAITGINTLIDLRFNWPDFKLANIFKGLCSGENFRIWLERQISAKILGKNADDLKESDFKYLTFGELYKKTQTNPEKYKHLQVISVMLAEMPKPIRYNTDDAIYKDVIISDAVRASMSLPGLFMPHKIHRKNELGHRVIFSEYEHIDGGLTENFALEAYDELKEDYPLNSKRTYRVTNEATLGLVLSSFNDTKNLHSTNPTAQTVTASLYELAGVVSKIFYNNENTLTHTKPDNRRRTIYIDPLDVSTQDFDLSKDQIDKLITSGKKAVDEYHHKLDANHPHAMLANFITDSDTPDNEMELINNQDNANNSNKRNYETQNNAGLSSAHRHKQAIIEEIQQPQHNLANNVRHSFLSSIATVSTTLLNWLPRSTPNIELPIPPMVFSAEQAQQTKDQTNNPTLDQISTDNLHVSIAKSLANKTHTPVYETYKAVEDGGFTAQCDEQLQRCDVKLTYATLDKINEVIADKKQVEELAARTNPNGVVMFDAVLTLGMFAAAKTYQWYRGENNAEVIRGENRLLSAQKIAYTKPELIKEFSYLNKRYNDMLLTKNYSALARGNQEELYKEVSVSFKVLKKQIKNFTACKATIGDLLDIRQHIREINNTFDEVNDLLFGQETTDLKLHSN